MVTINYTDPMVADNQIVVIQGGTGNVSDAEQVSNTINSLISNMQIDDDNDAMSIQEVIG
ncbi:hypothetical protein ACJJI5_20280 [Microbulbifer sp. EKSA008]|uniref:hypothetical protein n=1 Tax=Microbulbifer sp. EKSA008 TaxID=3243367 RepID=UPI004041072E